MAFSCSSFPAPHSAMHEVWYFSDPFIIWFSSLKQWKANSVKELIVFHLFSELNQLIKGLDKCKTAREKDCEAWSREGNGGSRTTFLGGTNLVHEFRCVSYLFFLTHHNTRSIFPECCCPWDCAGQGMENLLRSVLLLVWERSGSRTISLSDLAYLRHWASNVELKNRRVLGCSTSFCQGPPGFLSLQIQS